MYTQTITNEAFTAVPMPITAAPVSPAIGYRDAKSRWWTLAVTPSRIAQAHAAGIDLAQMARTNAAQLFKRGTREGVAKLAQALFILAGGDDDPDPNGISNAGTIVTAEDFGRSLADPAILERAGRAFGAALADYFTKSRS